MAEKTKVAEHGLINVNGGEAEKMEDAIGATYTLLANGKTLTWRYDEATGDEKRMLALMGWKTKATNETSQARNNEKGPATPDEQFAAAEEFFTTLRADGIWTRERVGGVGAKLDHDALEAAIVKVATDSGKTVTAEKRAEIKQKLAEDPKYVAKVQTNDDVRAAYKAIVGRPSASVDDLLNI
jgi:hypothetical protein